MMLQQTVVMASSILLALSVTSKERQFPAIVVLDGHGSRFELDFLEYINTCETKWKVNIGLPYGTSYWQVGYSTEQNGCFKMALTKAKQKLATAKNDAGLPFEINKTALPECTSTEKQCWSVDGGLRH
jgi:hypothetical protein